MKGIPRLAHDLRAVWACMKKDIRTVLASPMEMLIGIIIPVNFLILASLFVVSGGRAPTAVVMQETGPYAQQFYEAMATAHAFRLEQASAKTAEELIQAGRIVAVVTIPADFDTRLRNKEPVQIDVEINNLNTDFTNDIRRAVPLSITSFYSQAFPNVISITPREHDLHAQDTDYLPYLGVSIFVIALLIGGLLQAGVPAAREWEQATIKELLLSPASRVAIVVGKMLGAFILSTASTLMVLAILILLNGVWPIDWGEVIGFTLLIMLIFIALGTVLGTLLRQRQTFTALAFGTAIPLFFLSGAFGPLSFFGSLSSIPNLIAQILPIYYAIVLEQHAFHGFDLNTYSVGINILILVGYALALVVIASLVLRQRIIAR